MKRQIVKINIPDRYKIIDKKSGGMGDVLICQDHDLDRNVAIKFMQSGGDLSRIMDEISALQKIRSKHVVEIYDIIFSQDRSEIGIVEEYIGGQELDSLNMSDCSTEELLKLFYQIAAGISDIHEQGIIHRDIKPFNMKLDTENIIKIFDFGLARTLDNAYTSGFRGTLGYAAPELYSDNLEFTSAIDTYAFGITIIYLINNELPDELQSIPPTPHQAISPFRSLPITLPERLIEILELSIAENPMDRPEMSVIRDEIARYLLYGKHKALIIFENKEYELKKPGENVVIKGGSIGRIKIKYDGHNFFTEDIEGEVFINNMPTYKNQLFPGSCVITIGDEKRGFSRRFITFDISHPEVVL